MMLALLSGGMCQKSQLFVQVGVLDHVAGSESLADDKQRNHIKTYYKYQSLWTVCYLRDLAYLLS